MPNNRNQQFNFILFIFLVLILFILAILILNSFFMHTSILEVLELNKELHEKLEHLEITQQEKTRDIVETVDKKLTEIANHENLSKKHLEDPTFTQWVFIGVTLALCFYVMVSV